MRLNRCMDKTEEEILLEACRKQDAGAYKRLYDLYAPRMFALCLRYAGSRADAEDMLHDGFVHIFEHIKNQEIHRSLPGWIRKVMVNTAISYLRKTWVRQYEDMEVAEEQEKGEDYNYEPYDTELLLNAIKGTFIERDVVLCLDDAIAHHVSHHILILSHRILTVLLLILVLHQLLTEIKNLL